MNWKALAGGALLLSVGINGFLAGMLITGGEADRPRGGDRDQRGGEPMEIVRLLPEDRREELNRLYMEPVRGDIRRELRALRGARRDVREAMYAEPFEAEELEAALERLHAQEDKVTALTDQLLIDMVGALTPQEREMLKNRPMPRRGWRSDRREGPPRSRGEDN